MYSSRVFFFVINVASEGHLLIGIFTFTGGEFKKAGDGSSLVKKCNVPHHDLFKELLVFNHLFAGYIHERTLYEHNEVLPHLKKRINDDISAVPQPYRILHSMLMGPGFKSGFMFVLDNNDGRLIDSFLSLKINCS